MTQKKFEQFFLQDLTNHSFIELLYLIKSSKIQQTCFLPSIKLSKSYLSLL